MCALAVLLALLTFSQFPYIATRTNIAISPHTVTGIEVADLHRAAEMDLVRQAGSGWVRIAGVWWPDVEPLEGQRNWDALSWLGPELLAARMDNLAVVLVVRGTPPWAQAIKGTSCGPIRQDKLGMFADFVSALVSRYSREPYALSYYELGNEPDIDPKLVQPDSLWGCWGNDADAYYGGGAYASMLQVVYPRVKQVDPDAQVLVGGLALDCDPRPGRGCPTEARRRPGRFMEGVLRAGGGPYFDGISFHSYDYYEQQAGRYSNKNFGASSGTTGPVSLAKAGYLRSLLSAYAVGGRYLLNTEAAVLCRTCNGDANYEWTKAYYAAQANAAALADGLRANIWFRLADWPDSALLDKNRSALPAYRAHAAVTDMLAAATFDRALTSDDVGVGAISGYAFRRASGNVWVVWAGDGQTHQLALPSTPREVRDVLGQTVPVRGTGVTLSAPDRLLVYVEW